MKTFGRVVCMVSVIACSAYSDVIITAAEVGDDVTISYAGTINLNSLTPWSGSTVGSHGFNGNYLGMGGVYNFSSTNSDGWEANDNLVTSGQIGSIHFQPADAFTGDAFGINHNGLNTIELPTGYVSGSLLSGMLTYNDTTLAGLGIFEGVNTAVWTFGTGQDEDSITFTTSTVPEPATALLLGFAVGLIGLWHRVFRIH